MPVTGYLGSTAGGYPLKLFNLIDTPLLFGKDDALADVLLTLHRFAQWAVYGLILLHVGGVVFQVVVIKSGVLGRMLPRHAVPAATSTHPSVTRDGVSSSVVAERL